ncbi:MAG: hypothetical protein HZC41_00590 [Chloroflexi bacterium]|nr:hypothetical protein [Chloroflexota bacterium]
MPKKYSPETRAAALAALQANNNDILLTSLQTGVSSRTLYDWRRQLWLQQSVLQPQCPVLPQQNPPLSPADDQAETVPEFENDLDALAFLRRQIMRELVTLSAELQRGMASSSPYQRVLALSQLLDRLMKLDEHLQPYLPAHNQIRTIEYIYPDGSRHDVPPWYDDHKA